MPLPGSTASAEMKAPKSRRTVTPPPGGESWVPVHPGRCWVLRLSLRAGPRKPGSVGELPRAELREPLTSPRRLRKAQMQVFSLHSRSVSMRKSRVR